MILADTSAWVEYDRATGSAVDQRLTSLVVADIPTVAVTEPVIAEACMGARSDARERDLRRFLGRFQLLPLDTTNDFDAAVRIYRACRRVGVTPRGLIDCLIAAVALRHDAALLAADADIRRIAEVMPLRLDVY
ncbi:MAG TPA: PIN domain nuclease [Actinomycetales bacterium]|nr:PIN domain nuclease [Actinomycetales bacterium]